MWTVSTVVQITPKANQFFLVSSQSYPENFIVISPSPHNLLSNGMFSDWAVSMVILIHTRIQSRSFYHPGPLHKIPLQSVHNFLSNVCQTQVARKTNTQTDQLYHNKLSLPEVGLIRIVFYIMCTAYTSCFITITSYSLEYCAVFAT